MNIPIAARRANSHPTSGGKLGCGVLGLAMLSLGVVQSAGAEIIVSGLNMFRDIRGENNAGVAPGDRVQYGGNVQGGADGTQLSAAYFRPGFSSPSFTDPAAECAPIATNRNFCSNSVGYSPNRVSGTWKFTFSRNNESTVLTGPAITGFSEGADITSATPHPTNVTISGGGVTPTIAWKLPDGYTPDGLRVQIFDHSDVRANGTANIIHSVAVDTSKKSYPIPKTLSGLTLTGQPYELVPGRQYSINFQVIETKNNTEFTNSNAQIISRSNSWFNFTPLTENAPSNVFLPTVTGNGAFQFHLDHQGPNSVTYIDPIVAIGYDYVIGQGDPNRGGPDFSDNRLSECSALMGTCPHRSRRDETTAS